MTKELMGMDVKVVCALNGMKFDGTATDSMKKATRGAMLGLMAAQGEAVSTNRRNMRARGIGIRKAKGIYKGRSKTLDPATVKVWRAENRKSIAATAKYFQLCSDSKALLRTWLN